MKTATIEILHNNETMLGSRTSGNYLVREFEDGVEMAGEFFKTIDEAESRVREYQGNCDLKNDLKGIINSTE